MRNKTNEVAILLDRPPDIEFCPKDGVFYVYDPTFGLKRAMRPQTMLRTFENAAKALQSYHAQEWDGAEVIAFPDRAAG